MNTAKRGFVPRNEAERLGFSTYNSGPHLCVDVPDGFSTITCRMSNGEKVVFAFIPYRDGAVPNCVDIAHTTGKKVEVPENDGRDLRRTNAIVFEGLKGGKGYHFGRSENEPTLVCVEFTRGGKE